MGQTHTNCQCLGKDLCQKDQKATSQQGLVPQLGLGAFDLNQEPVSSGAVFAEECIGSSKLVEVQKMHAVDRAGIESPPGSTMASARDTAWSKPYCCMAFDFLKHGDPDDLYRVEAASSSQEVFHMFLPMDYEGNKVLVPEVKGVWRVVNSFNSDKHGIAFRKSKSRDHVLGPGALVEWGEFVEGKDEGDGWLRCRVPAKRPHVCAEGHVPILITTDGHGTCDSCKQKLVPKERVTECGACNWWFCETCSMKLSLACRKHRFSMLNNEDQREVPA